MMKTLGSCNFILVVSLVLCSSLLPQTSSAEIKQHLLIQFSYTSSSDANKQVTAYRLYKEGELVCEDETEVPGKIDCTFWSAGGTFNFTLSAQFADGSESPQSAPFPYKIYDESAIIGGLKILTGQQQADAVGIGSMAKSSAVDLPDLIHLIRNAVQTAAMDSPQQTRDDE